MNALTLRTVDGTIFPLLGQHTFRVWAPGTRGPADITFEVAQVRYPIVSMGHLAQ